MQNLKNLLQLEPSNEIQLEKPSTIAVVVSAEDNPDALQFSDLYNISITNQPFVKADESRIKSAELGKDIARAGLLPSLSAFGGLNTNYSTRGKRIVDGAIVDNPYSNQIDENFGQNFGLSLSIPIYNNHRNLINMDRAELNTISSQYTAEINKQNLKNNIQTALSNARAAKRTLAASERTKEASNAAFQNSEKQFQLGTINTFEYATAKNNLDQAEVDLIIAKYDYLFKLKVLDFYQGKKLELK
ncbi:MAG: TolC family protein [Saprospiraceae bacterium]